MTKFNVTDTFPSSIIRDFNTYLDYCLDKRPKLTKTNQFLGRKNVFELNQMMEQRTEGLTARNDQNHYPLLHLFYHLALQGNLFFMEKKKANFHFSPQKEKVEYFHSLNPTEQYFYLFKTFFVYCDWENIQLQDRARIFSSGMNEIFEWCLAHQPNELISFDYKIQNNYGISTSVRMLGVVMIYLEYFGFWKGKLSDYYQTKTHLMIDSVLINEFGIKMCECIIKSRGYSQWNIYEEFEMDDDYFEAVFKVEELQKKGKSEEEAVKIVEAEFEAREKEFEKFKDWDFEDFFQNIFPEGHLGKIEIKAPKEFREGIYTFKISLSAQPKIWRRIQLDAKHTLYDLHMIIQAAFEFGDDHLYSFFPDGNRYSKISFHDPRGQEGPFVNDYQLGDIEHLSINKKMLYVFDYGDEWWFDIILEKIEEGSLNSKKGKIIESVGESPEQYPDWEEE